MVKIKLKIIVKKLLFPYYKMRYRVNTRGGGIYWKICKNC